MHTTGWEGKGTKREKFEKIDGEKKNIVEAIIEKTQHQNHLIAREEESGYFLTETCSISVKIHV